MFDLKKYEKKKPLHLADLQACEGSGKVPQRGGGGVLEQLLQIIWPPAPSPARGEGRAFLPSMILYQPIYRGAWGVFTI